MNHLALRHRQIPDDSCAGTQIGNKGCPACLAGEAYPNKPHQRGVTLIELMVSLVIGLVISLAAAGAYIGTRGAASAQEELSRTHEYGKQAMDMIGRELQMAGFFPVFSPNNPAQTNISGKYEPPAPLAPFPAYAAGIFGCSSGVFQPTTATCLAGAATDPDSVVVNYFSNPEFGAALLNQNDCLGQNVANNATVNAAALAAGQPLFISNRYALTATTIPTPNGGTETTRSFACNGNGQATESNTYQPIFEGVEDLVIRYGVWGNAANQQAPSQYYTATQVGGLGNVEGVPPWQRVTSVHICMLVRTLQNTKQADEAATPRTFADCRGNLVQSNRLVKTFERTFSVRNHIFGVF